MSDEKLGLQSMREWIEEEMAREDPPWLLSQMVLPGGLTLVASRPKLGKSMVMAQMVLALASGKQLGPFRPARPVRVLLFDLEGVGRETARRFFLLAEEYGISEAALDNIKIARQHFKLTETGTAAAVVDAAQAFAAEVVVLDTFAKAYSGVDENSAREMQKFLDVATDVRQACGVAVIMVLHTNKQQYTPRDTIVFGDPDGNIRGSSAMAGAYDCLISLIEAWVDGEFQRIAMSRGKYTPDFWMPYKLCGVQEPDANGDPQWVRTWVEWGDRREDLPLLETPPRDNPNEARARRPKKET